MYVIILKYIKINMFSRQKYINFNIFLNVLTIYFLRYIYKKIFLSKYMNFEELLKFTC